MNMLRVMYAVNTCLLMVIAAFCVKYDIPAKLLSKITNGGGGIIDPVQTENYKVRVGLFESTPHFENVIVMLGDSLTEYTPFNEFTGFRYRIQNRGIASDNTHGVLHRLDEVIGLNAAKVFILLGINDIGNAIPLTETIRNYREIVNRLKESSPSTKIYVQSVFPVDHRKLADNDRCRRRTSSAIVSLNAELEALARETGCEFVDTYSVFADELGEMDSGCTLDGLHLNGAGMMKWCGFLEEYLQQ